ncbi:head completion/stabilization protein [Pseudomonas helleri]|uniref:head completion/stabilization protein n=1 Tax=Pseudomonas helleri TaxID=1608996 RepID=UPI003FD14873
MTSLRKALSLSSSISEGRLRTAAHGATATVNKALTVWQQHVQQQGYGYLEEVPAPTINNCSVLVAHYLSAVEATAAIELYQHFKIEKCGRRCSMNEPPAAHLFTHE